jgi:hypothetical protein
LVRLSDRRQSHLGACRRAGPAKILLMRRDSRLLTTPFASRKLGIISAYNTAAGSAPTPRRPGAWRMHAYRTAGSKFLLIAARQLTLRAERPHTVILEALNRTEGADPRASVVWLVPWLSLADELLGRQAGPHASTMPSCGRRDTSCSPPPRGLAPGWLEVFATAKCPQLRLSQKFDGFAVAINQRDLSRLRKAAHRAGAAEGADAWLTADRAISMQMPLSL